MKIICRVVCVFPAELFVQYHCTSGPSM
jgi:hypothetical protein